MLREIIELSEIAGIVSDEHANRVIAAVCRKISHSIPTKLIRVYRKETAQNHEILIPIAGITNEDVTQNLENISIGERPQGVLSWCVHNKEPLWLEDVSSANEETGIRDKLSDRLIDRDISGVYIRSGITNCISAHI